METTRKIRNVGIADLFIPFGPFDGVNVKQGEVADVPDAIAVSLLEQPNNWIAAEEEQPADAGRQRAGAKTAAKKDGDE